MNIAGPNNQQKLIARVLTLHFQEGLSQAEIASNMDLSTAKVNRLIKQGRELGMVEFIIHSPYQRLFELERAIKERWNLDDCVVVESVTGSAENTLDLVGKAAAEYIAKTVNDGGVIAISGGKAVSAIANNLDASEDVPCTVLPLTGGVQSQHYTDVNHLATRLAEGLGGEAVLLHAPLHSDTLAERDLLMSVRTVRETMERAANADIAVFGVGSVEGDDATYYEAYPLSNEERKGLYETGVRSEFLGHLIDESGALCDVDLNSRLVSLPLSQAKQIPCRMGVVSGLAKAEPVNAALNGGYLSMLVIDDEAAQALLG
ncbi:MAG: sugar-binding transcriptional regulator [Pseudomonadota bacterium]|nr:sugar-binding transcriptional regulator [Pseudomonadota bacterium]